MADNCIGIGWIIGVYERFENKFLEIEEIIQREISEFAQSYMQTESFLADHSPSPVDVALQAIPDLSLVQDTNGAAYLKSSTCTDVKSKENLLQLSSTESLQDIHSVSSSGETVDIVKPKCSIEAEVVSPEEKDTGNESLFVEPPHVDLETELDSGGKMLQLSSVESVENIRSEETDDAEMSKCLLESDVVLPEKKHTSDEPLFGETHLVDSETELDRGESSDGSLLEEVGDNNVNQEVLQTIQSTGNSKLDGSCILVDSTEVHSSSHKVEKRWSYKEKIQYIASKLKLAKKQDYEQQSKCCGDVDMGLDCDQQGQHSVTFTVAKESTWSDQELCQSEWQIV
ncbi:hypothetical protein FNV43_RR08189 [Rhamnella rubrinervis]|uniref:Uncharacterized protein n=1 Tax=Rhamnella rubrinervis TaxID=2594499 RepID=A0A8K0MNF1_9ROSA|nr:hypothetical protein FNV43_RR08189 [Rhamnella rubrinervis]